MLLDGANRIGAKILVSGGGRCNVTHDAVTPSDYFGNRRIIKNVLAAFSAEDTVEWFAENGGLTRANGDRFRRLLLSRGGSMDVMDAFRELRGRDPEIGPLLTRRGLR